MMTISKNLQAFLDMIAVSELGAGNLAISNNGYNVLVGCTPQHPLLFSSYADHPNILNKKLNSTAAGRYQILYRWWLPYKKMLGLKDFGPAAQDAWAIQNIKEQRALPLIEAGQVNYAILKCNKIWASLTGSPYGQHTHPVTYLVDAYKNAGGAVA